MLEPDHSDENRDLEDPWDGPSPEEPKEENIKGPESATDRAVGVNELRVVRKIEESMKASKGPRIQVIKSRDLKNARSFAEKVYRVLRLHGYRIKVMDKGNIYQKAERSNSDSITVYAIDEPTIKEALGEELNGSERPIRALFDRSMLSYMKAPVLIVVVSDEFYGETGLQDYAQGLAERSGSQGAVKNRKRKSTRQSTNRATPVSLYLAAVAFMGSGLNAIFGSYLSLGTTVGTFLPLPIFILLISIAAIVVRAISLGNERIESVPFVVSSILLFIALTVLGIFAGNLPAYVSGALNFPQVPLFSAFLPVDELFLAYVFYILAMLRFILYLGRGSGRGSYALTIFGIVWITFIIYLKLVQPIFLPVNNTLIIAPVSTSYPTDFPIFGFNYNVLSPGTPQYMVLMNYLILIGNLIMAVGLLLAARTQKALLSVSGAAGKVTGSASRK